MSLLPVKIFRLRQIERLFGSTRRLGDRCGCQNESRYDNPQETVRLWCGLVTEERRENIRSQTQFRLLKTGWMVWQPESVGFSWAEILEIQNIEQVIEENSQFGVICARPLEAWEDLAGRDLKFRIYSSTDGDEGALKRRLSVDVVREVLQRNSSFSHVNVTVSSPHSPSSETQFVADFQCNGMEVERLRTRLLPSWQSRDMAIQTFTTYTMTRKDT